MKPGKFLLFQAAEFALVFAILRFFTYMPYIGKIAVLVALMLASWAEGYIEGRAHEEGGT